MSRVGVFLLLFAAMALLPGFARAQSDTRPPDVFPPAGPGVEDRPSPPNGPGNPLARLGNIGLGGLGPGGPGYSVDWYPSQSVKNAAGNLGLVRQDLSLLAPIWSEGGDTLIATANLRNTHIYTDALLPDTRRTFPKDLWNATIGLGYLHGFDNGWTGGLMVNVGSASDKPFYSIREVNVSLAGLLKVPAWNDGDFWIFMLLYSPGGLLNFPIPGVAYQWNYSEKFHLTAGIPFSVMWKPAPDWTFNASYVPLTNIKARLNYQLHEGINLYGGYDFLIESYFLADRVDRYDRFLSLEQRVIGGVKFDILKNATLDLHAGYSFGRYFGEGRNQGATLHDRVDVAPGGFLGAALRMRF